MQTGTAEPAEKKYSGVRQRSWGKWVSEIRVPGTQERLWLGSYSNPEAAAVAHDTAVFFLRGPSCSNQFNFPDRVGWLVWTGLSPRSVQKVAGDNGMAVDAELVLWKSTMEGETERKEESCGWDWIEDISLEDMDF